MRETPLYKKHASTNLEDYKRKVLTCLISPYVARGGLPLFIMDTLAVRLRVPPVGPVEDFHLQAGAPPGRATKQNKPDRVRSGLGGCTIN